MYGIGGRIVDMPPKLKTYIIECFGQAPHSWRRGAVVMTIIINAVLLGALLLGSQFTQYPTAPVNFASMILAFQFEERA